MKRIFLIVLDSFGIGEMEDAALSGKMKANFGAISLYVTAQKNVRQYNGIGTGIPNVDNGFQKSFQLALFYEGIHSNINFYLKSPGVTGNFP